MSKYHLLIILILLKFFICNAQQPPNIIIILADDLGYGDISALNKFSKVKTPFIDDMINNGISFSDAHSASSVCSPSRYAMLTGRYAWRSELKKGVLKPYDKPLIDSGRLTVARMLQLQGYETACIGKWHLGWDWPLKNGGYLKDVKGDKNDLVNSIDYTAGIENGPTTRGFDYYFGTDVPNYPPYTFVENNKVVQFPDSQKPSGMFGAPGVMVSGWKLENILPALSDKAEQYISEKAKSGKAFFLYVPLTSPHTPVAPIDEFKNTSKAGRYGDFVQQTDQVVGNILRAVKDAGIENNTLIVFTSDNGSPENDGENMNGEIYSVNKFGHDPSAGKQGIKADIYEGGHRVPFIVKWPAVMKETAVSKAVICNVDIMATIADITKTKLSDKDAPDSYSLLPLLKGNAAAFKRNFTVHHSITGNFAIRKDKWKLIMSPGSGGWSFPKPGKDEDGLPPIQLFNLDTDPGETKNVYDKHPETVATLKRILIDCIKNGRSTTGTQQMNDGNFLPATTTFLTQ